MLNFNQNRAYSKKSDPIKIDEFENNLLTRHHAEFSQICLTETSQNCQSQWSHSHVTEDLKDGQNKFTSTLVWLHTNVTYCNISMWQYLMKTINERVMRFKFENTSYLKLQQNCVKLNVNLVVELKHSPK